ncbi:MAG TPA: ATP-binding cassette domain-containing protein [Xanthomonadales bacterium]|nr:ATP-binding cassette domain-containing protein [Xanthomonadales bacterium]
MLEVDELTVFYENALALNNLSLEVRQNEIVGVFGSNSAGKTTLMNTVAGLTRDLKIKEQRKGGERITILGKVRFEGQDILESKASQRVRKGIVLSRERHPVFRDSLVHENLKISGYLRPNQEVDQGIDSVYALFPHLHTLKDRRAGLLSGGEQQMLAIGMALVAKPRLLLLDEPLLGLSPMLQLAIVEAMRQIQRQGITILVAEQYARPIFPVIDRGYIMENGTLIMTGTGEALMDNPEVKSAYFGI